MYYFGPLFPLIIVAMIVGFIIQARVSSTYRKFSQVRPRSGVTGAQVARELLDKGGAENVSIEAIRGRLSDHYDPRTHTLRLSEESYSGSSLAALGVAAHEAGHALQHAQNYSALAFRNNFVPVVNFGSRLLPILLIGGLFTGRFMMILPALIVIYAMMVVFHIVTLPVEFNASRRALGMLESGGYLTPDEMSGARSVLTAAALTYVAGALIAVLQLLNYVLMSRNR